MLVRAKQVNMTKSNALRDNSHVLAIASALDKISEFESYYTVRVDGIEQMLVQCSENMDGAKSIPEEIKIKAEIQGLLCVKAELDLVANIFALSAKPLKSIKYVETNTPDKRGNNPV